MNKMIQHLLFLSQIFPVIAWAQPTYIRASLPVLDSLLISGNYAALNIVGDSILSSKRGLDTGAVNQYRNLLNRITSVLSLPDSVAARYAVAGKHYEQRFLELDAGSQAVPCFQEYLKLLGENKYSRAYERYLVADFFRQRYVSNEKERLQENLIRAKGFLAKGELDRADEMVILFNREQESAAFGIVKERLEREYAQIAESIQSLRGQVTYESHRVEYDRIICFSFVGGLDPFVSIPFSELAFFRASDPNTRFSVDGELALSKPAIEWGGEVGVFAGRLWMVGARYFLGNSSEESSFRGISRVQRFHIIYKYNSVEAFLRYYFDSRTGFRSFLGLTAGRTEMKVYSEITQEDADAIMFVGKEIRGIHLAVELGQEFVPSETLPFVLAAQAKIQYAADDGITSSHFSIHLWIRAGFAF